MEWVTKWTVTLTASVKLICMLMLTVSTCKQIGSYTYNSYVSAGTATYSYSKINISRWLECNDIPTVQLKGNVALARYCLARFSNTIHSILDTRQRSLAVYRV